MTLPLSSTINNYGNGILVDAVPMVDPTSELSAASLNAMRNDLSAMTMTAPRLIFQFTGSATTPSITSSSTWAVGNDAVWGNAPAVTPILTRMGTGVVQVTLPASVQDQLGASNLVNIRAAQANIMSGSTPGVCVCNISNSSVFLVQTFNMSGALNDFAGATIFVRVF